MTRYPATSQHSCVCCTHLCVHDGLGSLDGHGRIVGLVDTLLGLADLLLLLLAHSLLLLLLLLLSLLHGGLALELSTGLLQLLGHCIGVLL